MPAKAKLEDFKNKKFSHLKILDFIYKSNNSNTFALCKCDCGKIFITNLSQVKNGYVKSCGCFKKYYKTHYMSRKRIYRIWIGIKQRCNNPNRTNYKDYGGRGIKICEEWLTDFMNFYNWAIKNGYKDNLTIERINVNGNYEPNNCTWATMTEQMHNKRLKYNNKSNVTGVSWNKSNNKWRSVIWHNSKKIHLGYYNTIDEAKKARKNAEIKYWGKF